MYLDLLTPKEYIFGLAQGSHLRDPINAILLSIKFYKSRQKMFHECNLEVCHWLLEFKTKLLTENWIRSRIGARPANRVFNRILDALG